MVLAAVFGVAWLIFNLPGPLVVQCRDDTGAAIMGARVSCTDGAGKRVFNGITDVFGEAKWPGLSKEMWFCSAIPPDRFQLAAQDGSAQVRSRSPATVSLRFERPMHVDVEVARPRGAPRSKLAVLGFCPATQTAAESSWEARINPISADALLWLPFGRACRAGLVHPQRSDGRAGLVERARLDCDKYPCTEVFSGASGQSLELKLAPGVEQWTELMPPVAQDPAEDGGTPGPDGGAPPASSGAQAQPGDAGSK